MFVKVVIGGCRDFYDYEMFKIYVDLCLSKIQKQYDIVILSGNCRGTDALAEKYAKDKKFALELYPAQWEIYGKSAGPIRNRTMVENADYVIAFWDHKSKGTKNLIATAKELNKPLRIKNINRL